MRCEMWSSKPGDFSVFLENENGFIHSASWKKKTQPYATTCV